MQYCFNKIIKFENAGRKMAEFASVMVPLFSIECVIFSAIDITHPLAQVTD
jgi:hypothetical protein